MKHSVSFVSTIVPQLGHSRVPAAPGTGGGGGGGARAAAGAPGGGGGPGRGGGWGRPRRGGPPRGRRPSRRRCRFGCLGLLLERGRGLFLLLPLLRDDE